MKATSKIGVHVKISEPTGEPRLVIRTGSDALHKRACDRVFSHVALMVMAMVNGILQSASRVASVTRIDPFTVILAAGGSIEADHRGFGGAGVSK